MTCNIQPVVNIFHDDVKVIDYSVERFGNFKTLSWTSWGGDISLEEYFEFLRRVVLTDSDDLSITGSLGLKVMKDLIARNLTDLAIPDHIMTNRYIHYGPDGLDRISMTTLKELLDHS